MVTIKIHPKAESWAISKRNSHITGCNYDSDVDKKDSVLIGYLGEAMFWVNNKNAIHVNCGSYDFILNDLKYEVKSYWSKFKPQSNYLLKVPIQDAERVNQDAIYYFICVDTNNMLAHLLGEISKEEFVSIAALRKKGAVQNGSSFKYTTDCLEITVGDLYK